MESKWLDTNVTALHPLSFKSGQKLLLVGTGSNVELYNLTSSPFNLLHVEQKVFGPTSSSYIHGFTQLDDHDHVLVYGSKDVCQLALSCSKITMVRVFDSCPDWILSLAFYKKKEQLRGQIVALTAHNRVLTYDSCGKSDDDNDKSGKIDDEKEKSGEIDDDNDKSGKIDGYDERSGKKSWTCLSECEEKCILYSGTFVVQQQTSFFEDDLLVLAGTVFRQLLIWSCVQKRVLHRLEGHEGVIFSVVAYSSAGLICSTSDDRTARLWQVADDNWTSVRPLYVLSNGHDSRVFRALFISDKHIFTFGEDSCFCIWNTENGGLVHKSATLHGGSPIWSACSIKSGVNDEHGKSDVNEKSGKSDVNEKSGKNHHYVLTGGGDASVRLTTFNDDQPTKACLTRHLKWDHNDEKDDDDDPRIICIHKKTGVVFCLTNKGFLFNLNTNQLVYQDKDLQNYALMQLRNDTMVLATVHGCIKVLNVSNFKQLESQKKHLFGGKKVFSLAFLSDDLVLASGPEGRMLVLDTKQDLLVVSRHVLPECKELQRWFSCCLLLVLVNGAENHVFFKEENDHVGLVVKKTSEEKHVFFLVVGDRCGNLHLYVDKQELPRQTVLKAHGKHGVGGLGWKDPSTFLSTGRDGLVKEFALQHDKLELQKVHRVKQATWLDHVLVLPDNLILILAFHSTKFLVYNYTESCVMGEVECGGSHRSWHFDEQQGKLAFVKDKRVFETNFSKKSSSVLLRNPCHSRQINRVLHVKQQDLVATAGEDNLVRVFKEDLELIQTLTGHISSIKCLASCFVKHDQNLLFSAGGRAQLKVWQLKSGNELANHILGWKKKKQKTWKDPLDEESSLMDIRYMDLAVKSSGGGEVVEIFAACSDGVLRILKYDHCKSFSVRITLDYESEPYSHALLRVGILENNVIMVTTTDGTVQRWSHDRQLVGKTRLHQSGIGALSVANKDAYYLTGGDDCALNVMRSNEAGRIEKLAAHSAAITCCAVLDQQHCVTASVDQRVSLWQIGVTDVVLLKQAFSHVPDIQDMAAWKCEGNTYSVLLVGLGQQLLTFSI